MKKTVLFERHKELNAKIVDFAGYMMPISYSSVNEEHIHVRNSVGIFDVSHMGQLFLYGDEKLIEDLNEKDLANVLIDSVFNEIFDNLINILNDL